MEPDSYLKAKERMEKFFGKKIEILHDLLLHRKPSAVIKDDNGNVNLIVYRDGVTVSVLKQNACLNGVMSSLLGQNGDYVVVLRIPEKVSERLKLPQVLATIVPEDVVDITDPRDVVETFIAAVRFDLIEFFV